MKFDEWCFIPCVLRSDVFVNIRFKIRGWGETGPRVGSECSVDSSIGTLVTKDANVAQQPAEVNVKFRCCE